MSARGSVCWRLLPGRAGHAGSGSTCVPPGPLTSAVLRGEKTTTPSAHRGAAGSGGYQPMGRKARYPLAGRRGADRAGRPRWLLGAVVPDRGAMVMCRFSPVWGVRDRGARHFHLFPSVFSWKVQNSLLCKGFETAWPPCVSHGQEPGSRRRHCLFSAGCKVEAFHISSTAILKTSQ